MWPDTLGGDLYSNPWTKVDILPSMASDAAITPAEARASDQRE